MKKSLILIGIMSLLMACQQPSQSTMIQEESIQQALTTLTQTHPNADVSLAERGVRQVATLWQEADGTESDFVELVTTHYAATAEEKQVLYDRLSHILEQCGQNADLLNNTLQEPTTLVGKGEPSTVDWIISGYSPMAHFTEDMFANKIAHICVLNFPSYTLEEKNTLGQEWTRLEWAYARMGEVFNTRIPGSVYAHSAQAMSEAENYIAGYNIMMHCLRNEQGEQLWQEPMALLSHWNLRDELKSNYTVGDEAMRREGKEKQEMIYQVMLRIIRQDIPACVVNNAEYLWKPYSNEVLISPEGSNDYSQANVQEFRGSGDERYQKILDIFHAMQQIDAYRKDAPSHVLRTFNEDLEIPQAEIEALFLQLIQSDEIKAVAQIIRERLGRELRPYDIWYDGFKSRSTLSEDKLTAQTQSRYPTALAFEKDMPRMLMDLGFGKDQAQDIASHIVVEAARGSGHARPCVGRNQPARLRTRISDKGMDYKGYNIAVHEFGHNVEEVLSLYNIDYYTLAGIPNTGFTEASAFLFQQRDLQLLGYKTKGERAPHEVTNFVGDPAEAKGEEVLDMIWGMYEIMGVSLVDMAMWEWLYANPKATAAQLREAVIAIAGDIWNKYYAPLLGEQDCPLLGIYSHMVGYALYLPGYPIGQLVQFQLEEHLAKCQTPAEFAQEYSRIYQQGKLTPDAWMRGAVGEAMSVEPILKAVRKAL